MREPQDKSEPNGLLVVGFGLAGVVLVLSRVSSAQIGALPRPVRELVETFVSYYQQAWPLVVAQWPWLLPLSIFALAMLLVLWRSSLVFWHNVVVAKLAGTELETQEYGFTRRGFDLHAAIERAPKGQYFVGLTPKRRPVYLSERDLCTHVHLMGQTGSGKTASVITPLLYQALRYGKGAIFMDAKGSSENVAMLQHLVARTGRDKELRVFALAYPQWSHTYNPVWPCEDADATAERVLSVFEMDNEYYKGQAWLMFRNLVRVAASTGQPFNLIDLRVALVDDEAREQLYREGSNTHAVREIESQLAMLGRRRMETFTGLYNALADYDHPLLNSYSPSIVLEELVNNRGVCYFNLPANRYPILAPAVGKIVLQHLQALGALRQIDRASWDQHPFLICVDELNRFAFPNLVPALAMLRDAKMQFVLSHQSLGDLEQVSTVFATQVKDNTRCKIYLYENDPDHLETIARSYGTQTTFKRTVRFSLGPLWTFLNTGEVSNREAEEFKLHPNALKSLEPFGQGYVLRPDQLHPVNLAMLPEKLPEVPDPSRLVPVEQSAQGLNLVEIFLRKGRKEGAHA